MRTSNWIKLGKILNTKNYFYNGKNQLLTFSSAFPITYRAIISIGSHYDKLE